jgi:hypothetical protein
VRGKLEGSVQVTGGDGAVKTRTYAGGRAVIVDTETTPAESTSTDKDGGEKKEE